MIVVHGRVHSAHTALARDLADEIVVGCTSASAEKASPNRASHPTTTWPTAPTTTTTTSPSRSTPMAASRAPPASATRSLRAGTRSSAATTSPRCASTASWRRGRWRPRRSGCRATRRRRTRSNRWRPPFSACTRAAAISTAPPRAPSGGPTSRAREAMARADGYGKVYMHFDKDERAYSECGLFVHPLASTVTYLTSEGAPTLVVDARLSPEGKYVEAVGDAHIVPPRVGRHVRFDGRLLHGAPLELLEARGDEAPYVRVTFLVNIWIGHRPRAAPATGRRTARSPSAAHRSACARRRRRRRRGACVARVSARLPFGTTPPACGGADRRGARAAAARRLRGVRRCARRGQVVRLGGCELRRTG